MNITYKVRQKSDYINVIYRITNEDSTSHSIGFATYMYIELGSNNEPISNLKGMRGMKITNQNDRIVYLVVRNSYDIIDVDTYNYEGNGNSAQNNRWKNRTSWEEKGTDYNPKISFSWQDKVLQPKQSIELIYALGSGEYMREFDFDISLPKNSFFTPGSSLKVDLFVESFNKGDKLIINRDVNKTQLLNVLNTTDTGVKINASDNIDLSAKSGYYTLNYLLTVNGEETMSKSATILVTDAPTIKLLSEVKRFYYSGEFVELEFEIWDDTYANIYVFENDLLYNNEVIICNRKAKIAKLNFSIPDYLVGTQHNITFRAGDEFGIESNTLQFTYTIIENKSPILEVFTNFNVYYPASSIVKVKGRYNDPDGGDAVCLYTSINNSNVSCVECTNLTSKEWHFFNFDLSLPQEAKTTNIFRFYCIDDKQGRSNAVIRTITLIDMRLLCRRECATACNKVVGYLKRFTILLFILIE